MYAYTDSRPEFTGLLKIGCTTLDVRKRVAQQYPVVLPGKPPCRIMFEEPAMRNDGTVFTDHDVHACHSTEGVDCSQQKLPIEAGNKAH